MRNKEISSEYSQLIFKKLNKIINLRISRNKIKTKTIKMCAKFRCNEIKPTTKF